METLPEKTEKKWTDNIIVKMILIAFLILVLMIPSFMVESLVNERSNRKAEVTNEVSSKWGQLQTITGPYVAIPYLVEIKDPNGKSSEWLEETLYYFPASLHVNGELVPVERKRSIFKVILYESRLNITGNFKSPDLAQLNVREDQVMWDKARLHLAITDLSGIGRLVNLQLDGSAIPMGAATPTGLNLTSGLMASMPDTFNRESFNFSIDLDLKGSTGIYFTPVASETKVSLKSTWPSPKFEGNFLPDTSEVKAAGFSAQWTILDINRQIAQQWTGTNAPQMGNAVNSRYRDAYAPAHNVQGPLFGVELLDTVDHYTKNQRTIKYAFLLITLTFAIYFFAEVLKRQKVHPLQYALVGAALVIFFILLLSLSEHLGFEIAYMTASLATVLLITFYSRSIFTERKYAWLIGGLLSLQFVFIYIILQLEDYALLAGSITLFVILAVIMYLTRKVKWT